LIDDIRTDSTKDLDHQARPGETEGRENIKISGYIPGAIGIITEMHATYYHQNWNFGLFFERKVATEMSEFLGRYNRDRDGFWVAVIDGRVAGSIAVDGLHAEGEGAHLRWFIVSPEHQGRGIGTRLLQKALAFSRACNFRRLYLWTFEGLGPARRLYEKYGFTLYKEHRAEQWGRIIQEQQFELLL